MFEGYDIKSVLYLIPAMLIGLTVHEFAHALVANLFGDPTAKNQGRLTLNPLKHLDPLGTILLLVAHFGWAKPVPVNRFHMKGNRRVGMILVSAAGPISNILVALVALVIAQLSGVSHPSTAYFIMFWIVRINIILAAFNLIPIPPLDGSGIVQELLPGKHRFIFMSISQYGPLILLLLVIFGMVGTILNPIVYVIERFLLGVLSLIF